MIRVKFSFKDETWDKIQELAKESKTHEGEIVRKAVSMYVAMHEAMKYTGKVTITRKHLEGA